MTMTIQSTLKYIYLEFQNTEVFISLWETTRCQILIRILVLLRNIYFLDKTNNKVRSEDLMIPYALVL